MFSKKIAQQMVDVTMEKIGYNINVMDQNARIIASGDPLRIGRVHQGAKEVLDSGEAMYIYNENELDGSQPGVNLPIQFHGEIEGVIGITGRPDEISQLGELAVLTVELLLESALIQEEKDWRLRTHTFAVDICLSEAPAVEALKQKLSLLGISYQLPCSLVLFETAAERSAYINIETAIRRLYDHFSKEAILFSFVTADQLAVIFFGNQEESLVGKLRQVLLTCFAGVRTSRGKTVDGIGQLRKQYQSLRRILAFDGNSTELSLDDFTYELLVASADEEMKKAAAGMLKGLSASDYRTLTTFFACNLNLSETARGLFIHRNTLIYRLNHITEVTGVDPRDFRAGLVLYTALILS